MKLKRTKLIFCSFFIAFATLTSCSNKIANENTPSSNDSNKGEVLVTEKNEEKILKEKLNESLKENYTYKLDDSSFLSLKNRNTNEKYNLNINYGNLSFENGTTSSYNISFENKDKTSDLLLNNTNAVFSSIKNKEDLTYIKQNNELSSLFSLASNKKITFNNENTSISSLFNEVFSSINESSVIKNSGTNEYKFISPSYEVIADSSSLKLKEIKTNKENNKSLNYEIDLKFNEASEVKERKLINEDNPTDFLTTLTKLFNNSNFKTVFDINIEPIKENKVGNINTKSIDLNEKSYHFKGDINFDLRNSDLLDNSKIELNLTHYTSKDLSNEISLQYKDTNVYFRSGNLIKGKIKESSVSSLIDTVSLISDDTSFSSLLINPLNNIFNNDSFLKISEGNISSIDNINEYLKELNIRNNVISLKIDTKLFSLPSSILSLKIGLNNLKLKTIEIDNFKINDEAILSGSLRFIENSSFSYIDEKEYPSYDFLPSFINSIYKIVDEKRFGGKLSFAITNKKDKSLLSLNTKLNASLPSFDDLTTSSFVLNSPSFFSIDSNGNNNFSLPLKIEKLSYQEDKNNKKSIFFDGEIGKNGFLPLKLKMNEDLLKDETLTDFISSFSSFNNSSNNSSNNFLDSLIDPSYINLINTYIDKIMNNKSLKNDLNKVINDFSLSNLESLISIYNDGNTLEIRLNTSYLFNDDLTNKRLKKENNDINDEISLFYNIKLNKLSGIYLSLNEDDTNITLSYGYNSYSSLEFVSKDEEKDYLDASKVIETISSINSFTPSFSINNIYDIVVRNFADGINIDNAKLGINRNNEGDIYSEGMFNLNINNSTSLDFKFIYDDKEFNDESFSLGYNDGNIIFNDPTNGIIFPEGQLQAEIRLNNMVSPLHLITKTSSPFNCLSQFLSISDENVLATFRDSFASILDELFNQNLPLFTLISNKEYLELLDKNIFKDYSFTLIENMDKSKSIEVKLLINPAYLNNKNEKTYSKDIEIYLDANLNQNNVISLNSLKIDATDSSAFNLENFYIELKNNGKFIEENTTSSLYLLDSFEKYDKNTNSSDFVNLDDCISLIKMGLNTTENHYFHLRGQLNLSNIKLIGIPIESILNWYVKSKTVDAKIELIKPSNSSLYSQTKAHLTIYNTDNPSLTDEKGNYVEFFTERLPDGQEVCYISRITAEFIDGGKQIIQEKYNAEFYSLNKDDFNQYIEKYGSQYVSITTDQNYEYYEKDVDTDLDPDYTSAELERGILNFKYRQKGIKEDVMTIDKHYEKTWFGINILKKICVTKKAVYKCEINIPEITQDLPDYYKYNIETFKITQDEILGSVDNIPNIIYYLMDYALIEKNAPSRDNLIGVINYQVSNSISSSGSNEDIDLFGPLNNFDVKDNSFNLNFDLKKLLPSFEGLNGIDISLKHDAIFDEEGNEKEILTNIFINGSPNSSGTNLIIDNIGGVFSANMTLDIQLIDQSKNVGQKMERYNDFIEAYKSSEQTTNLEYFKILSYENDYHLIFQNIKKPITNGEETIANIVLYSNNPNDPNFNFITGLPL